MIRWFLIFILRKLESSQDKETTKCKLILLNVVKNKIEYAKNKAMIIELVSYFIRHKKFTVVHEKYLVKRYA